MKTIKYRRRFLSAKFIGKNIPIILLSLMLLLPTNSCTDNFAEYNTDKTTLMSVGDQDMAALFSDAIYRSTCWFTTDHYMRMNAKHLAHLCGYMANNNLTAEQNLLILNDLRAAFSRQFINTIPTLQTVIRLSKDINVPAYSIALIYKVFVIHQITDLLGPVPYTKIGSGETSVPYESQKDVYYKMFEDLTSAIASLTTELQNNPALNVFGAGDMIYNGNAAKWLRFANSLRLRLAIRISNIDPDKAKLEAEAAAAGLTLETNADDALCAVTSWVAIGSGAEGNGMPRSESFFVVAMSTTMESYMVGYNDPRLSEYWSPVVKDPSFDGVGYLAEFSSNLGGYHGMTNGYDNEWLPYFRAHSKFGPRFRDGNQLITPINIMNTAETYFLKAEGAWRGWNMGGGTAQSYYEKGIEISIKQWRGEAFSSTEISNYINSTATPVAPDNHPYYDPAVSDLTIKFSADRDTQYEQILTQKWLALYPICPEAFAEYRRTRLPKIYAKKHSANPNINLATGQIVTRFPFPLNELLAQPDEIAKAIVLLGGPDLESTPVWWDVNTN